MTTSSHSKPIRVGFDLDGVLLYNPLRVVRPFISTCKTYLISKQSSGKFFIPRGPVAQAIWRLPHLLSMFTSPGFDMLYILAQDPRYELYLVTSRYHYLLPDLQKFIKKYKANAIFAQIIHNKDDEQPHIYKSKKISDLSLDFFVEDNWDIVNHLSKNNPNTKVLWMYNLADRSIAYPFKFPRLSDAIRYITIHSHV